MNQQKKDDDEELVVYKINKEDFVVPKKYKILGVLGSGSYGIVLRGQDSQNIDVAIKKNRNVFPPKNNNQVDKNQELIQMRILRELKVLVHLEHDNIVQIVDVVKPPSIDNVNDVYFVFEFMDTNLSQVIKSQQSLSDQHIQAIMYQILLGLNYIHSADILHRDLKPENILINSKCEVKICDFGLARGIDFANDPTMSTNFIQTRWYRAPEMLLDYPTVTKQVDMWSIGCIFAELLQRKPLFPGSSPFDQLQKIISFIGTPNLNEIPIDQKNVKSVFKDIPFSKPVDLKYYFPKCNLLALDLLAQMLVFDPNKRINTKNALTHPYFKGLYSKGHVKSAKIFNNSFEDDAQKYGIKKVLFSTLCDFKKTKQTLFSDEELMELQSPMHDMMNEYINNSPNFSNNKSYFN